MIVGFQCSVPCAEKLADHPAVVTVDNQPGQSVRFAAHQAEGSGVRS